MGVVKNRFSVLYTCNVCYLWLLDKIQKLLAIIFKIRQAFNLSMVTDDDEEFFCGMVDRRKTFSLISRRDHCQRLFIANLQYDMI